MLSGNFCRSTRHKQQIRSRITNSVFVTFSPTQNVFLRLRHLRYLMTYIFSKIKINWDFLFLSFVAFSHVDPNRCSEAILHPSLLYRRHRDCMSGDNCYLMCAFHCFPDLFLQYAAEPSTLYVFNTAATFLITPGCESGD